MPTPFFSRFTLALLCCAVPAGGLARAQDATPLVDRVGTLPLTEELDARGALGGMAVDRLGFLYVANFRDAVWRISPEGEVSTLTRSLYGASGNAVDARGRVYQSNFFGNTIVRIERTGEIETFASEGLEGPVGIAVDEHGTLFVCNCTGNNLVRVSPTGKVEPFADSDAFACPNGITFDDGGTLFVTNFNNQDILRVSSEGEVAKFVTVPGGAGNAHIAFSKGFFFVTKILRNQVVKVSRDGEQTILAGTGQPGHDDGNALEASFFRPNGLAVSPAGDIVYVNTMVGAYRKPLPSRVTVRTIELTSLTKVVEEALDGGSLEDAVAVYRAYKADPVRGKENTSGEAVALGFRLLSGRKIAEALELFRLNAESYPEDANAQFGLGEAHRYTGGTEQAIAQYRRVLELQPDHPLAASRLAQLGE